MHGSSVRFFLITNENITANFLARYFAKKLRRGFTIKNLVLPVKRELLRLSFHYNFFIKQGAKESNHFEFIKYKFKFVFKSFILFIFSFLSFNFSILYSNLFF